ncbi:MAG: hypothetical protein AAFQ59_03780 [Pseudomonadota bacterium]
MPRRLIVHAGFHKTGTTSIQRLLDHNRAALPDLHIVLRPDMLGLCEAARKYSVTRDPVDLGFVQYEAAMQAESWTRDTVLLSSEDLSGHMPGRRGIEHYDAAPPLAAAMAEAWEEALPGTAVSFVYTLRDARPWLASCYVQHLRATRIAITADHYAREFAASADLISVVAQVQGALPDAEVRSFALEAIGTARLGPGDAVLAHAGVAEDMRAALAPVGKANTGMNAQRQAAFLALNRSHLHDAEVRAEKDKLS